MANEIRITVTAENKTAAGVAAAKATVRELTGGVPDTIPIRVGTEGADRARTDLRAVTDAAREVPRSETTTVRAETSGARTELREVERAARATAGDHQVRVNANTGGAVGNIRGLYVAIASLIPIAIAASGAIAGIGAVGIVGLGAVVAGFSGVGDAVTAMGQKASAGGASAAASAATIRNATRGVEAAQRDLRDSYDQVAAAAHNVESAHLGVAAAERGVADAAYNLAAAQRGVQDAQARVQDAEWAYGAALRSEASAQQGVADARQQAARALQDLRQQTEDMALSQEDASLAVEEAQARAIKVASDPMATELEKKRADLSVRMAQQREKDLTASAQRLAEDKAAADAKGVEGSDLVTAAQQRLVDAQHQVQVSARGISDAQQGVADAEHRVVQAQQALADAQQRVKDAQYAAAQADKDLAKAREGVTLATQRLADAQLALKEAQAKTGGGGGVDKLAEAMAKLGPNAREFAEFMRGFIDGPLADLRKAGQEAFLPGVQSGLKSIEPAMRAMQPAFASFSGALGQAIGGLMKAFAPLAKPLLEFASAALQGLAPLQGVFTQFATSLGGVLNQLVASGAAKAAMQGLVQIIEALLPILPGLVDAGTQIMAALGPALATVIQALVEVILQLLPSLVQMAPLFAQWMVALAPLLPQIGQLITSVLQLVIAFAPVSIQLVNLAVTILGPIIGAIASLITWIATKLTPEFQRWGTFFELLTGKVRGGFDGLVTFVAGIPGRISGFLGKMWDPLWNGFKTIVNRVVDGWNRLHFSIPGGSFMGMTWSGLDMSVPQLPHLAAGGVVKSRPGGTAIVAGEGGQDEAVVPLDRLGGLGGRAPVVLELRSSGSALDDFLLELLRGAIRVRGGDVQVVLGQ